MKKEINVEELNTVSGGTYTGPVFRYVVQKGDCLNKIALKYNTTVPILVEINHIQNPNLIYAGTVIYIPSR